MKNSSIDMKNHTTNGTNAHTNGRGEVHARIGRGDGARDDGARDGDDLRGHLFPGDEENHPASDRDGDDLRGHLFPGDEENHPASDRDGMVTEAFVEAAEQGHIDRDRDAAGPGRILDQSEQPAVQVVELVVASTDLGGQFGIVRAQDPFGEAGQLGRHPPHLGEPPAADPGKGKA